jgi:hypothetical protein
MKTWEKIVWPIWMLGCGFAIGWSLYVLSH